MRSQLRSIIKPALVLFIICFIVTAALALTYAITKDTIAERAELDAVNARREVLVDASDFKIMDNYKSFVEKNKELDIIKEVYEGIKDSSVIGYVFSVESKGYGGIMKITVGVNVKGEITGVKIGDNSETPGLGSKASDKRFLSQFINIIPSEPLKVVKAKKVKDEEIAAVSGATISSKAVTKAVQAAVDMTTILIKEGGKME